MGLSRLAGRSRPGPRRQCGPVWDSGAVGSDVVAGAQCRRVGTAAPSRGFEGLVSLDKFIISSSESFF